MKNNLKKSLAYLALQAAAIIAPLKVFAGNDDGGTLNGITGDLVPTGPQGIQHIGNIIEVIQAAIKFILLAAFVLAFVFLIIGGIRWIVAGGDEKGVAGARGMITAALIGLVIVLVSFALIKLVESFFNVQIISGSITVPQITSTPD